MNKLIKHGLIMAGVVFAVGGTLILTASKIGIGFFALALLALVVFLGL